MAEDIPEEQEVENQKRHDQTDPPVDNVQNMTKRDTLDKAEGEDQEQDGKRRGCTGSCCEGWRIDTKKKDQKNLPIGKSMYH